MKCALHGVDTCPMCEAGPAPAENMAVDADGRPLPFTPHQVREIVNRAVVDGDLVAAILRMPGGDLCVQVFGPPSHELVEMLETTLHAYKRVLQGH